MLSKHDLVQYGVASGVSKPGTVAACLLAVIVVNVGTAWLGAVLGRTSNASYHSTMYIACGDKHWELYHYHGTTYDILVTPASSITEIGLPPIRNDTIPYWSGLDKMERAVGAQSAAVHDVAVGWPFRAWGFTICSTSGDVAIANVGVKHEPILIRGLRWGAASNKVIPGSPIWTGLVANCVLVLCAYAAIVGLYELAKRVLRARTTRCVVCGYLLVGLDSRRCPECGCHAQ